MFGDLKRVPSSNHLRFDTNPNNNNNQTCRSILVAVLALYNARTLHVCVRVWLDETLVRASGI